MKYSVRDLLVRQLLEEGLNDAEANITADNMMSGHKHPMSLECNENTGDILIRFWRS